MINNIQFLIFGQLYKVFIILGENQNNAEEIAYALFLNSSVVHILQFQK